ncbi:type VI secretion system amidase immunity protein Tai4 [Caballeronia sp. NK8]|uniref:type VI secretion system amidase immunity protein Tai4 n=1 Tax=Caballeronia sp. NK8 TaxID=140098 RepID=UPI001BB6192B|nr:type VI secretion system amidase immunity protein Tai4 [Caballeronia sp. NK8]BCQ25599.1 type VI secretion system amidase immunity protein Tai4 [Caballeronia sp. NK8]
MIRRSIYTILALACAAVSAQALGEVRDSPEAPARTYAQNYRDMVLATCVAIAYKGSDDAAIDAGSSVSALRDWTLYDLDMHPEAMGALVRKYLARDYYNPLVEAEVKGRDIRFDFLKCLDLYHSKELDRLVKQLVIDPNQTIRSRLKQDKR